MAAAAAAAAAASNDGGHEQQLRAQALLALHVDAYRHANPTAAAGSAHAGAGWEPQEQYQRTAMFSREQEFHLCFPLELTNTDYVRRVLSTVAEVRAPESVLYSVGNIKSITYIIIIIYKLLLIITNINNAYMHIKLYICL